MFIIPLILLAIGILVFEYKFYKDYGKATIAIFIAIVVTFFIVGIDRYLQTRATEIWSGKITKVEHKEEWEEFHPSRTETYTDSKGNVQTRIIPAYWEHHYAKNYITTSDNGVINAKESLDGKVKFDDSYPNTNKELEKYYKIGTPTSSSHTYTNKIQASYSIYKSNKTDLKKYSDLPEYPISKNQFQIDRILGNVPNKNEALKRLDYWNTELNKSIPDTKNKGKMRSWKQVNMIFVNVGENKGEDYGFALQDKWKNGNKNDFIVAFSMDKQGNVKWAYPITWSESEELKLEVRDYMMELKNVKDFVPVVDKVSNIVAEKFERKEFADFNYLNIELRKGGYILIWIANILIWIIYVIKD